MSTIDLPSPPPHAAKHQRLVVWSACAAAFGVAAFLHVVAVAVLTGQELGDLVPYSVPPVLLVAAMAIAVWRSSDHLDWRSGWMRFLAIHVATATSFTVGYAIASFAAAALDGDLLKPLRLLSTSPSRVWIVVIGFGLYVIAAGVSYVFRMERRLERQEIASARLAALASEAQLRALRARLQPHFLFNAFHSILALMRDQPRAAEQALDKLAGLLRYALDDGDQDVPLAEEWAFTREYLAIESLRYGDRLCVRAELDEDALDQPVPTFLLQPLVENAVRHGVARSTMPVQVWVRASIVADTLVLVVRDDGPGTLATAPVQRRGVGLDAIEKRLNARYGETATLAIDSVAGRGWSATIRLPLECTDEVRDEPVLAVAPK